MRTTPSTIVKVNPATVVDSLKEGMAQVAAIWPEVEAACHDYQQYIARKDAIDALKPRQYDSVLFITPSDAMAMLEPEYKTWPENMLFIATHATEPFTVSGEDMVTLKAWLDGKKAARLKVQMEDLKKITANRVRKLEEEIASEVPLKPPPPPPPPPTRHAYDGIPRSWLDRLMGRP